MTSATVVAALAAVAAFRFAHAFVRLRRRGRTDHAGWDRAALFAAGLALAAVPLVTPLASKSLAGHMVEHVLIGDAAVALVLVSLRGPLLFFVLPPSLARRTRLRQAAALVGRPWVAVAAWACAYALWHIPPAYDYAAAHEPVHALEHASFVAAGVLVWIRLLDRELSVGIRLALAGALFVLGQALSDVLLLAPQPLYEAYGDGQTALHDQQLAGLVMMAEQLLVLGTFAALLVRSSVRGSPSPAPA